MTTPPIFASRRICWTLERLENNTQILFEDWLRTISILLFKFALVDLFDFSFGPLHQDCPTQSLPGPLPSPPSSSSFVQPDPRIHNQVTVPGN
ncbi:cytochrome p450 [Moniliophthora roreri]|uniref:Uncharacterized protein n=1 Tax=Moniliophthora roreri TaxID=221103 RepID=A0A0W0F016_MONRR|nr:cytochrome p450 [Moniliophthora roreri]